MLKVLKIAGATGCLVASLAFAFQKEPVSENNPGLIDVVVIDAGHGGHDSGTKGKIARESRTMPSESPSATRMPLRKTVESADDSVSESTEAGVLEG